MLKASELEARALPAALRAYSLTQLARGYARVDTTVVPAVLTDAFTATIEIQDDNSTTSQLQRDILFQLLPLDSRKVNTLLPQASEQVRSDVTRELIRHAVAAKRVDEAVELTGELTRTSEFPYEEGPALLAAFPKEESWRKSVIFSQALESFSNHQHRDAGGGRNFVDLIRAGWKEVPAEEAEKAIDEVLRQAKEADENETTQILITSDKGDQASFGSVYDYSLFELLPILKEINNSKAESLLRDEQAVKALLTKYPNGHDSLVPANKDGLQGGISTSMSMSTKGHTATPPHVDEVMLWQAEIGRIMANATKNPKQALAQAQTVPVKLSGNQPLRPQILRSIASASLKSDPAVSKEAIADLVKSVQDLSDPKSQVRLLSEAAKLYLALGDEDQAKSTLEAAAAKANDAVRADSNADDPNLALKAYWPSTVSWQTILRTAARISPSYTQKLIDDISDEQIRTLARIAIANEMAGAPPGKVLIAEKHGKSMSSMSVEDN